MGQEQENYGTKCPHHEYVVETTRNHEDRIKELELSSSSSATMMTNLCSRISELTDSINTLVLSYANLDRDAGINENRLKNNEDGIREVRGWVVGAVSATLVLSLGWIIWWLQNGGSKLVGGD